MLYINPVNRKPEARLSLGRPSKDRQAAPAGSKARRRLASALARLKPQTPGKMGLQAEKRLKSAEKCGKK
jgi:hypothetical protein